MKGLRTLRSNLVEMSRAGTQDNLVSFGKRVFHKGYGWGKVIHFFSFGKQNIHKLEKTLQHIQKTFTVQMARINEHRLTYFKHLSKELRGERFSIIDKEKASAALLEFCLYLKPLIKGVMQGKEASYLELLLGPEKEDLSELKSVFSIIHLFKKIKDVEITLKTPLPYIPFMKAASGQTLKVKENTALDQWLTHLAETLHQKIPSFQGLKDCKYANVHFLHRFLQDLISFFRETNRDEEKSFHVGELEKVLTDLGCPLFRDTDSKHMEWVSGLHPGSEINAEGKTYILGEALQTNEENPELSIIFALEDHPDLELVIERNEAIPYLRNQHENHHHCGIIRPKVIAQEDQGGGYIQERILYPLSAIDWKTQKKHLDKKDQLELKPLVQLLKGLMEMPVTPHPLTRETFGYTQKGEMRARQMLVPRAKSFSAIASFTYLLAQDPRGFFYQHIYDQLMIQSGLNKKVK